MRLTTSELDHVFEHFWAALDQPIVSQTRNPSVSKAFLSSLLECLVFLISKLHKEPSIDDFDKDACRLASDQSLKFWENYAFFDLHNSPQVIAKLLAESILRLGRLNTSENIYYFYQLY